MSSRQIWRLSSFSVVHNIKYSGHLVGRSSYYGNCLPSTTCQLVRRFSQDQQPKPRTSKMKLFLVGGLTFCATYAAMEGLTLYREKKKFLSDRGHTSENHLEWDSYLRTVKNKSNGAFGGFLIPKETLPTIPVSREVSGSHKLPGLTISLFQYQTCPFCCKVRTFLDYFGLPYNVVEVDPVLRQQVKFSSYRKVPILIVDEKTKDGKESSNYLQLTDSSLIISILASFLMYNKGKDDVKSILDNYQTMDDVQGIDTHVINKYFLMIGDDWSPQKLKANENRLHEERYWREWADNVLVHMISPNVYRTFSESLDAFNYFSEVGHWKEYFPTWERFLCIYMGAVGMYFVAKRLKRRHRLKEDVRASLYDECRNWMKAIGKDRKFMGGNTPNLADLAVYGALSSFEGCEAFQDLLKNVNIGPWYYSVKELCKAHAGSKTLSGLS